MPPPSNLAPPMAAAPEDVGVSVPEPAVRSTALASSSPAGTAEADVLGNGAENTPAENPPAACVPESGSDNKVAVVQLTMAEKFKETAGLRDKIHAFEHDLRLGVSRGLGIPMDAVGVGAISAGSVVANVIILSIVEKGVAVVNAHACAQRLVDALQEKTSEMHQVCSPPSTSTVRGPERLGNPSACVCASRVIRHAPGSGAPSRMWSKLRTLPAVTTRSLISRQISRSRNCRRCLPLADIPSFWCYVQRISLLRFDWGSSASPPAPAIPPRTPQHSTFLTAEVRES